MTEQPAAPDIVDLVSDNLTMSGEAFLLVIYDPDDIDNPEKLTITYSGHISDAEDVATLAAEKLGLAERVTVVKVAGDRRN